MSGRRHKRPRWDLSPAELERIRRSTAEPIRVGELSRAVLRSPKLAGSMFIAAARAAAAGAREHGAVPWLVQAHRVRRAVPDAAVGVTWHGEEPFLEALRPFLDPESRVLEVGCGGGRIARLIAEGVGELVCTDVSELMLDEARRGLTGVPNVSFQVADALLLDGLGDESFDLVYAHDVFVTFDPHMILVALDSFRRVLTAGGVAVASFYTIDRPEWARQDLDLARRAARRGRFGPSLARPYTSAQIDAWFQLAGFEPIGDRFGEVREGQRHYIAAGRAA